MLDVMVYIMLYKSTGRQESLRKDDRSFVSTLRYRSAIICSSSLVFRRFFTSTLFDSNVEITIRSHL